MRWHGAEEIELTREPWEVQTQGIKKQAGVNWLTSAKVRKKWEEIGDRKGLHPIADRNRYIVILLQEN